MLADPVALQPVSTRRCLPDRRSSPITLLHQPSFNMHFPVVRGRRGNGTPAGNGVCRGVGHGAGGSAAQLAVPDICLPAACSSAKISACEIVLSTVAGKSGAISPVRT